MSDGLPSDPPGDPESTVPTIPHDHPVPRSRRVAERVVVGSLLLLILSTLAVPFLIADQVRREAAAEFDRRSEARDEVDAQARARVRDAVCIILGAELEPTENVLRLAAELECPLDPDLPVERQPVPPDGMPGSSERQEPAPPGTRPAPAPSSAGRETAAPRPAEPDPASAPGGNPPRNSPENPPQPSPSPSPSPTCRTASVLGRCLDPVGIAP